MAIAKAVADQQNVVVVCETGNTNAAAGICGYLIEHEGYDVVRSFHEMQIKRFSTVLDDECLYLLQSFEDTILANGTAAVQHAKRRGGQDEDNRV